MSVRGREVGREVVPGVAPAVRGRGLVEDAVVEKLLFKAMDKP